MKFGSASGMQIAFFTFALLLLIVPVTNQVVGLFPWNPAEARFIRTTLPFMVVAIVLVSFPLLRAKCVQELSRPLALGRRREAVAVSLAGLAVSFAWAGLWVLWWWVTEGPVSAGQHLRLLDSHDAAMADALSLPGALRNLLIAVLVAPLIEELLFRCLLFRAWAAQWGWFPSMVLTSALFGLYHPNFIPAFASSVVYVCLYRRTGSLWAPIGAHAFFNLCAFYPLLGRFVFPRSDEPSGDLANWEVHLACLLFVAVALPAYVFMSRDREAAPRWTSESDELLPQ
ncbi:MAG TPA: type II CAAX endopeptidase family protein [Usitatibacter sp.]|nr:type II CAAX endopeptidase family protein [Usitatibacter sp.]